MDKSDLVLCPFGLMRSKWKGEVDKSDLGLRTFFMKRLAALVMTVSCMGIFMGINISLAADTTTWP